MSEDRGRGMTGLHPCMFVMLFTFNFRPCIALSFMPFPMAKECVWGRYISWLEPFNIWSGFLPISGAHGESSIS
jgi:hypothetical protein